MTIDEARQIVMSKFASTNSRANHVLPMRTLRFTVMQNLNREDQEIFVNGINELIQRRHDNLRTSSEWFGGIATD